MGAHQAAREPLLAEPVMRAAVPLHHDAGLGLPGPAAVRALRAPLALGPMAGGPADLPDLLAADRDALALEQGLGEVGIVEVLIDLLVQRQDGRDQLRGQGVAGSAAPVAVAQPSQAVLLPALMDALGLPVADVHVLGGFLEGQDVVGDLLQHACPVGLFAVQDDKSLHDGHLHEGDIFSLQLWGT